MAEQSFLGLTPWAPNRNGRQARMLEDALTVLNEWVGAGVVPSLTTRALLYRMLPLGWSKEELGNSGRDLSYVLNRARRAGRIPFRWIADGRSNRYTPDSWTDADQFMRSYWYAAESFTLDRLTGQPYIEVWVESAGMVEMLEPLADELGTPIVTSSGFDTLSAKWHLANTSLRSYLDEGRKTVLVLVGDLDPHGEARMDNVEEDVHALATDLAKRAYEDGDKDALLPDGLSAEIIIFERAALTREQVEEFDIPTEPAKADKRGTSLPGGWAPGDPTAQAEALKPDLLMDAIRTVVSNYIDSDVLTQTIAEEQAQRAEILARLEGRTP